VEVVVDDVIVYVDALEVIVAVVVELLMVVETVGREVVSFQSLEGVADRSSSQGGSGLGVELTTGTRLQV